MGGGQWGSLRPKGICELRKERLWNRGEWDSERVVAASRGEVGRFFGLPLVKRTCFPTSISSIPPFVPRLPPRSTPH